MAFNSKMIGRITGATASDTHTAGAINASNNGGFSNRGTSVNSRQTQGLSSQGGTYGRSMIGQKRNKYPKALNADEARALQETKSAEKRPGYGRTSSAEMAAQHRFDTHTRSNLRFGSASTGGAQPRISGAANAVARPVPKPTFRRPF